MDIPKTVALTNLCHCCHRSHRIDDLHNYLKAFDEIDQQYYTPGMQFMRLYSEAVGALSDHQLDIFYQKSDALFEMEKEMEDLLLVYQLFINICMDFLVLKNKDYAARCLEILLEVNEDEDVKALREIHKLMIKYCKIFDLHDELIGAYERFYYITMAIEDMEQATYSAGLYTKIELHRAKEKQNDLKKENEQLEYMMNIDDLTSTANRRSFNHMLKNERVQKAKSLAFAMLDIDYFKEYNDRYGHQMGDQALIEFGKTLIRYAQEDILPFRYGGDEFVVFLSDLHDQISVISQCEKFCDDLSSSTYTYLKNAHISVSIGLAFYDKINYVLMIYITKRISPCIMVNIMERTRCSCLSKRHV